MSRDDVIDRLKSTEPALRALGIEGLFLFGSHARDEARPDSDVDVFVDPSPRATFGFTPFMTAYETLESALGRRVDYGTRTGLHPLVRETVEREAVRVF